MIKAPFYEHFYPSPNHTPNLTWTPGQTTTDRLSELLGSLAAHEPQTNINETPEAVIFKLVAPESEKTNFHVEVKDGQLRVTHKVKKETALTKNFEKKFELKGVLRLGSATASYNGGVLTVEIPKLEPKQISVK